MVGVNFFWGQWLTHWVEIITYVLHYDECLEMRSNPPNSRNRIYAKC